MSDKLNEVFEKHCSRSYFGDDDVIGYLTFDQFRAALNELVPSDGEILSKQEELNGDLDYVLTNAGIKFYVGAKWLRSKILGD